MEIEIEGSLLVVGLCPVSAITQEPNENPIAFLETLKEALQKFTNLDLLRLLRGTGDFKGQSPFPMCTRHQNQLRTAIVAGPCCLFR